MPSRNLTILFIALMVSVACYHRATRNRYAKAISHAMGEIDEYFVEPIDHRELFEGSMRGMIQNLDPYSGYVNPEEFQKLKEDIDQEFAGVGILVDIDPDTNRLMVLSPLYGSPAYEAGLRAGDVIMKIEDQETKGLTTDDTIDLIRGEPDTQVHITILPKGERATREVTLTRALINIESVLGDQRQEDGSWEFVLKDHPDIAYVRLISFGEDSTDELERVLKEVASHTKGLILDLRGNAGGLLTAAIGTADLFLDEGEEVVSIKRRNQVLDAVFFSEASNRVVPPEYPVAVLIDHYSASASEILSAALQDHDRATVVGQRSWGKGTVQTVIELEGGQSAMRLTTATYWRPSGRNIHRSPRSSEDDEWGVTPNDGFVIEYDDEEYIRYLRDRRNRDVLVRRSGANVDDDEADSIQDETAVDSEESGESPGVETESAGSATEEKEPFVDRQLQRAIEFIRGEEVATPAVEKKAA